MRSTVTVVYDIGDSADQTRLYSRRPLFSEVRKEKAGIRPETQDLIDRINGESAPDPVSRMLRGPLDKLSRLGDRIAEGLSKR